MALGSADSEQSGGQGSAGLPKLLKPYFYITAYYGAVAGVITVMLLIYPRLMELLPVGGAADFGEVGQAAFEQASGAHRQLPEIAIAARFE